MIAAALAALAFTCRNGVETDLYALLGPGRSDVLRSFADNACILMEGADYASLDEPAAELRAFAASRMKTETGSIRETVAAIAPRSGGLLSEETRARLLAGKFDEVARSSAAALVSGILAPIVSVKQDPYLLATDYFTHIKTLNGDGWTFRDGDLVCEKDGRCYRLLSFNGLDPSDSAFVCELADRARKVHAHPCGAPFHAAIAMEKSKREINVLSALSLVAVFALGLWLFRSMRFVAPLAATLACAFLAATAAVFAAFGKPHVLTFVFGTSLIGLGVDYVYHAQTAGSVRTIRRPLAYALATTLACFAPLALSSVSVLRQMALFTDAGLFAAWTCVMAWPWKAGFPAGEDARPPGRARVLTRRSPLLLLSLIALVFGAGVFRIHFSSSPANFYRPDPFLAEGEAKLLELNSKATSRIAVAEGRTLQEALEREEDAGLKGLSSIVPSLRRQRENAALVATLREKTGKSYTALTGVPVADPGKQELLDPEKVSDPLLRRMVRSACVKANGRVMLLSPFAADRGDPPPGVRVMEPAREVSGMFDSYARETYKLLGISFAVLAAFFVATRKMRSVAIVPVAAALSTLGVLGWCGVPLTFFHALCFFLFTGMGIDYAIFHGGNPSPRTRRVVFVSFLTSCAAFGLLAFTSFAVTRAMGGTLALGLFFSYLFSLATIPPRAENAASGAWYDQPERGAGRLRMAFLWGVYRFLGKNALKVAVVPVAACIYAFAAPVRRNLRAFYAAAGRKGRIFRHVLDFAWSLADKVDACTLKKNLPRLAVRDDAGGRAFRKLVASGKGAFLVSTHVGTVEVLPALAQGGGRVPHVHAFQQMGHDAAFTRQFAAHVDASSLTLHAVEEIGVETAAEMQAAIGRGDLVLMAGDRVSAGSRAVMRHEFLGRTCEWPKGVFVFARLMECPVFFVTCVRTGWNAFEAHFEQAEGEDAFDAYVCFLEREARARPDQWHHFHDFFGHD